MVRKTPHQIQLVACTVYLADGPPQSPSVGYSLEIPAQMLACDANTCRLAIKRMYLFEMSEHDFPNLPC